MAEFDVESSHSIRIAAPSSVVFDVAKNIDLSASPLVRLLFALRRSVARAPAGSARRNFKVLREEPGRALVLGLIGQFWTRHGGLVDFDPARFLDFDSPGYAKATWSFHVSEQAGQTELTTITRVRCLDATSRRKFRRYWLIVAPFSGLIRREGLRMVKARAESAV